MIRLLRLPAVLERRARTRIAHYRDIGKGLFTPPIHLGERCSAWPEHEVNAILQAQIAGSTANELRDLVKQLISQRGTPQRGPAGTRHE